MLICIMNSSQKKSLAERLYVFTDADQKDIAEQVGTTQQTITRWKAQGGWEERKAAETLTKSSIIKNYYALILDWQEVIKKEARMPTASEVDAQHKIASAIEKLNNNKIVLPQIITVFKEYDKWLVQTNPELAKQNTEFQKKFIHMKAASE